MWNANIHEKVKEIIQKWKDLRASRSNSPKLSKAKNRQPMAEKLIPVAQQTHDYSTLTTATTTYASPNPSPTQSYHTPQHVL